MIKINKAILLFLYVAGCITATTAAETRNLAPFSGIRLGVNAEVIVKQGSPQTVRLEGDSKDLEHIETKVRGDELVIKTYDDFGRGYHLGHVTVYITVPELETVLVSGSGEIRSDGKIKSDHLIIKVSGSGDISLETDANQVESNISGSGKIKLAGNVNSNEILISGSGRLQAEGMKAKECDIKISGSGNCRVDVSERLEVRVSGSGNVYYRGEPAKVFSNISGSGDLRSID